MKDTNLLPYLPLLSVTEKDTICACYFARRYQVTYKRLPDNQLPLASVTKAMAGLYHWVKHGDPKYKDLRVSIIEKLGGKWTE